MSTAVTVAQVGMILLSSNQSILHETTGNIAAPIVYHITNNSLLWAVQKWIG